ncbi:DUF456 domain-containing protein [Bacillus sp. FJAT-52991]|uniref:DUF456 domain-containing protein n=1 Tax=Bacillus kandeliae TaxID=3129297 RepID=A0ABZ2NAT4_9BACI
MTIAIWIGIVLLFVTSFVGLIFPIIPSVLVLWGGFLLYYFGISNDELSIVFWLAMGLFTALIFVADMLANNYFVKKYGGSKWGEWVAAIAVIVGSFIMPPFGILIVPFVAVLITELIILKDVKKAFTVGYATFVGFLSGTLAKVLIQAIMIGWFIVEVIL